MSAPQDEVQFLLNLQRLLQEGQFVATYKYALLLSLADLSVETGTDSDDELRIPTRSISEKFIQYYWRQTLPYILPGENTTGSVLKQNSGTQAAILNYLESARRIHGNLGELKHRYPREWNRLVGRVDQVVKVMPLWKLQTVGAERLSFLYDNLDKGDSVTLKVGVASCLRKFHGLVGDMVRGAWVRYVRRFNPAMLGATNDLQEFLFGSERTPLADVVPVLTEIQHDECFYCRRPMRGESVHVDHFIPWSRYPVDLGHNFVLAHARPCNLKKSDRIPCIEHLESWVTRNQEHGRSLAAEFDRRGIVHELRTSQKVARWAYSQVESSGGLTWHDSENLVPLPAEWHSLF